jgi:hypothetical protein
MMPIVDDILATAEITLAAALRSQGRERLDAMTQFMSSFERLAREVAKGTATWNEARAWATRNAERLVAAEDALSDWEVEMAQIFHGNEQEAERSLDRRSQHALAREVFRDTPADDLLAAYESKDLDREFQDEAHRLALDGPSWLPRTHTWWRWPHA